MRSLTQRLRPRKEIQFSNELVEIYGVWLACSGTRNPGYRSSFDDPGEDANISPLIIRSINDNQDIYKVINHAVIEMVEAILIDQVEEPSLEKED